jgi:hypothetical protein
VVRTNPMYLSITPNKQLASKLLVLLLSWIRYYRFIKIHMYI